MSFHPPPLQNHFACQLGPWKPKKPRHHRPDESKHLSGGHWAGRAWASKNPRLQGIGFVFDRRFLSICVPNRCSNPSVSQRRFLRKFLAGLQISQPWGPATKLLRTIQVQGFPQTRFSIQQLLSTEVHTCGRVDLVPRRHCRPCAACTKSCRFAYRLFGQRHTAKKLFYSTQKLFANKQRCRWQPRINDADACNVQVSTISSR